MITLVAALDKNRVIGKDNEMPWHLPADLKHFKETTSGHTIMMGRRTYESIGRALPNRRNIVLTSNKSFRAAGCELIHSFEDLKKLAQGKEEIFVIGGETIFKEMLPLADKMNLTFIEEEFDGDTYFPSWDDDEWIKVSEVQGTVNEKNPYRHRFVLLKRKR
ncbi:dihydrofolate reductase [Alteribacillus sp. HJP-4]|uniref:dihydrofolate reductase n=1 Tax=Alteribacillus sp. HJP-4 TaxID=2775394 RepID=UPI0035CD0FDF